MSEAIVEQQPLSEVERVIDTFVAPSKTFTDIFRSRSWWLPFLISLILSYAFYFTLQKKVGLDTVVMQGIHQREEQTGQAIPPEQMQKTIAISTVFTKGIFYAIPFLGLLMNLLVALLLWLGFNFILGGSAQFTRLFTVAMYAGLPGAIKWIISIVTMLAGNVDNFNSQNPAGTNIGYFLAADAPKWMSTLFTALDITNIWWVFLLGLGAAIQAKVKPRTGITLVMVVFIVIVAIRTVFAAL